MNEVRKPKEKASNGKEQVRTLDEQVSQQTGWRVGSTVCSSKGPRFRSQHSHSSSQMSVTPVQRDLMPPSGLCWHCTHMVHLHALTHIK